jgi:pimeloyl-ACP methyl ester carboxylesterase
VAAATGSRDASDPDRLAATGLGANLANVAFRDDEPARNWWDKQQAFALHDRTIDPFFAAVELPKLLTGRNERYVPGPGYHDRVFTSSERISQERGLEGTLQHYGVYLPTAYEEGVESPIQWWFHFRGGTAHIAAAAVPRIFEDMGEDRDALVVTPRGRGQSTWYVGKGHVDYQEVWDDVHRTFSVDRRREYISGHSMGGWATYLMTILYPDRFAAGLPASAPVTQGGWTGADFPGCDEFQAPDGETPCFIGANGGRPRDQFTRPLLENTRWVPLAIYHGTADELVHTPGVMQQATRLHELGYRYRMYQFPAQEHYGPPIWDQWGEGARYEFSFVRPATPPQVTYSRSMPFEHATEEVNSGGVELEFDFDRAYWMSGLEPVDGDRGVARFDGRSLAVPERPYLALPEGSGPASADQTGPYVMFGQSWMPIGIAPLARNAFEATLTGARAVRLDVDAMKIDARRDVSGQVDTEAPLALEFAGNWPATVTATIDGAPAPVERSGNVVRLAVPAGDHRVELRPGL